MTHVSEWDQCTQDVVMSRTVEGDMASTNTRGMVGQYQVSPDQDNNTQATFQLPDIMPRAPGESRIDTQIFCILD